MSSVILTDNDRERIEKLPIWAQFLITNLEKKLRLAQDEAAVMRDLRSEARLGALFDDQYKSNVIADRNSDRPILLPMNSKVTFGLGHYLANSITVEHRVPFSSTPRASREDLQIYGTRPFRILPASANVVYVRLED